MLRVRNIVPAYAAAQQRPLRVEQAYCEVNFINIADIYNVTSPRDLCTTAFSSLVLSLVALLLLLILY